MKTPDDFPADTDMPGHFEKMSALPPGLNYNRYLTDKRAERMIALRMSKFLTKREIWLSRQKRLRTAIARNGPRAFVV